jgi:DNA-binding NarL/FixJ family response regulator
LPDALRILIVDDHAAVRSAFRDIIQERPQLSVVGDASNGVEAIAYAHTLRPDVILMDIAMPHMDGVEATARIHAELPGIEILGLSMQLHGAAAQAIEQAGAAGFFVKGIDTQRLIDHLLVVQATRTSCHPRSGMPIRPRVLLADDHPSVVKGLERLISLECDVVGVVADGSEVAEAAARLQPVVTVMDLNLPNVSGLEACRRILQANPGAKVIVITGMMDETIRTEALAAGASGFVPKMAVGNELMGAITRAWADAS